MYKVRREIKVGELVKEYFDPNGIEAFGHVQEHRACQSPLAEIPGYSFNEAGQLQGCAMAGSKPKLFAPQQPTLAYFIEDPGKQDYLKQFANRVQETNGPIG